MDSQGLVVLYTQEFLLKVLREPDRMPNINMDSHMQRKHPTHCAIALAPTLGCFC